MQPVAKNTRLQSKLALKTARKSLPKAEKVAEVHTKNLKAPRSRRATKEFILLTNVTL